MPEPRSGGEAERLAREKLAQDKDDFVVLVPPDRHPSAPGFDVGGVGRDRDIGEDRITFGEAKESVAERYFTVRDVTALRGAPLRRNIGAALQEAGRQGGPPATARVTTALHQGRIDFQMYLRGSANYSERQRQRLATLIRRTLRAYLRSRGLSRADIDRAIQQVRVPAPIRIG